MIEAEYTERLLERQAKDAARIAHLEAALRKIDEQAFTDLDDDVIWMDDRTPLGLFIAMTLGVVDD